MHVMSSPALRFLVLGSNGGLGRALARQLAGIGSVTAWTRKDLDLSCLEDIEPKLASQAFDVLLNPAGMTSPDACVQQPELAQRINTEAPAELARVCQKLGRRFIHFSTDYVFDGGKTTLWDEDDLTAPVNLYGRTKRAGELAVLEACPEALVARVSWLFGPDKSSHPDQIITKALQSAELTAIADKTSSPTFTRDLCEWVQTLVTSHRDSRGVLHLCNSGTASWQEWGEKALEIASRLGVPVRTTKLAPLALAECTFFKDARPPHTRMSTERFTTITGIRPRAWQEALEEHLRAMQAALAFSSTPS